MRATLSHLGSEGRGPRERRGSQPLGDTPRQLPAVPGHLEGVREASTDDHSEAATHQPGHPTTAALGEVRESVMRTDSGLRYQGDRGQHREVVIGPANNKQAKVLHILIWSTV